MKIKAPTDVALLPWAGNYRDDAPLFELVSRYTRNQPDPLKAYEAERLCHWYGMGVKLPQKPRKRDLNYMREIYAHRWHLNRSPL